MVAVLFTWRLRLAITMADGVSRVLVSKHTHTCLVTEMDRKNNDDDKMSEEKEGTDKENEEQGNLFFFEVVLAPYT